MNNIDNHAYTIIVEQIGKAQNALNRMLDDNSKTITDIVYAFGNINALITLRDIVAPSPQLTDEDMMQNHLHIKFRKKYGYNWYQVLEETFEKYSEVMQ